MMMKIVTSLLLLGVILYEAGGDYVLPKPSYTEVKVPRFQNATLPCEFSFIEGTTDMSFIWHREDIVEEIEVEDVYAYMQQKFEFKEPQVVYSFHDNHEALEDQSYAYQERVSVEKEEVGDGVLTLYLHRVDYQDEGLYTCSAIGPHGKGEIKLNLLIQEEEEPPVVMDTEDDAAVARCHSAGWYKVPIVTWYNRREEEISENATIMVLEEKEDGSHRISSTLSGVKSHEIYHCHIRDAKKARRARTVHRKLSKIWPRGPALINLTGDLS